MAAHALHASDKTRIDECRVRAIALLRQNLSSAGDGVLAASPSARAESRGYRAVFARDAAICALGMALADDRTLRKGAEAGLATLAAHQAANGQIPKFVDGRHAEADFWYLGCIDATLWWLIGLAVLDRMEQSNKLRRRFATPIRRATQWLLAQEHQRFYLLQQNEASDWADIMPRSGFVLYSNALWYLVKRLFGMSHAAETLRHANLLFHPFGHTTTEYRRAKLLNDYARENARNTGLYLSFINFTAFGDEGDVFGNVLAVLGGIADESDAQRVMRALHRAQVNEPYPVRVVVDPIPKRSPLWRPYMARHHQNYVWQYHNGGIWPFVGGFWIAALVQIGDYAAAERDLARLAHANALGGWAFREWLHGKTCSAGGMKGQSWNAATYLIAHHAVANRTWTVLQA
jgi:glycogen debranching enzyme